VGLHILVVAINFPFHPLIVGRCLPLSGHTQAKEIIEGIYSMFRKHDCTLVEVNPLAETPEGDVVVCDAKINFDDNAEFRQTDVFKHRDRTQEDPREVEVKDA